MNRTSAQPGRSGHAGAPRAETRAHLKRRSDGATERRRGETENHANRAQRFPFPRAASPLRLSVSPSLPLRRSTSSPTAFTLIELIVVIILFAILAGFIAPRLVNTNKRQADFESAEVTRLLGVAARRAALASEIVAVEYDGTGPTLSLVVLREVNTGRGVRQSWIQDPLVPPVEFTAVDIIRAAADNQPLGNAGGKWWIDFNPTEPRPAIWLLVGPPNSDSSLQWQVELLPEETSASRRTMTEPSRAASMGALRIDLDAMNQGERAW